MIRDGIRPGQRKRLNLKARKNAAGMSRTKDGFNPVDNDRRRHQSRLAQRGAGNIISWAGGKFFDAYGEQLGADAAKPGHASELEGYGGAGAKGGDLLPDGTPAGKGKARVHTKLAQYVRRGDTPFGTTADLGRVRTTTTIPHTHHL